MIDGHSGIENRQVNSGGSGIFQLVLSFLKQGSGSGEFIIHATSNSIWGSGIQPLDFLSSIGFTHYPGQCQFHREQCYYFVVARLKRDESGFENHQQVQMIHNGFRSFADKIGEIYNLRNTEYRVIRDIGLSFRGRGVLPAPIEIEIKPTDVPLWVQTEKLRQLVDLETQKNGIQENIDFYSKFLPLLYATGEHLENSVVFALQFLGLNAEKAPKGYTVDVLAQNNDETKKFGFEVTGINEAVKKSSKKLTQVMEFERIKEHNEKTVLIANTYNTTPIPERSSLENFTPQVIDYLGRHPILMMTSLDLYRMIKDIIDGTGSKEKMIEYLYVQNGVLKYPNGG
jgi:hypothetical protein